MGCDDTVFGGSHEVTGSGWDAVVEIFAAECNACHGPGTAATFGNLDLETDPCGDLVGVPASNPSYGAALLVEPGDHEASVLWDKVAENGSYGGVMPTAGKMEQANIDIIQAWIDDGASCGDDDDDDDDDDDGDSGDVDDSEDTGLSSDTGGSTEPGDAETSDYSMVLVQEEVLDPYCKACHGGSGPSADLNLSDVASHPDITGVDTDAGIPLVVAGNPEGSYLYMKMRGTHDPDDTGERGKAMPPPGPGEPPEAGGVQDAAAQTLTYGWILEGANQ